MEKQTTNEEIKVTSNDTSSENNTKRRRKKRKPDRLTKLSKRTERIIWILLLVAFLTTMFRILPGIVHRHRSIPVTEHAK